MSIGTNTYWTYPLAPLENQQHYHKFLLIPLTKLVVGYKKYYTSNTDDIFGNWTRRENLYETWCTDYEFYYKLPTGYQNITISIEEHSSLPQPVITIIKNDTWQTANGYRRNSFQNILYYKGPARGWAGNTELDYQIHGQNLVNTGSQTYDLVTGLPNPYQPRYDVYTRF